MIYETDESRKIEDGIAESFANYFGYKWARFIPKIAKYDTPDHVFSVASYEIVVSETKRRYIKLGTYADYFIDKAKVDRLLRDHKRAVILLGLDDTIAYINPRLTPPYKTSVGGRNDRNDKWDQDVVYHFRWADFKVIEGSEISRLCCSAPYKSGQHPAPAPDPSHQFGF